MRGSIALLAVLVLWMPHPAPAQERAPRYDQIHFDAQVSEPVDNDRMQAALQAYAEGDDPATLAAHINDTMQWALQAAKHYANVQARTSSYATNPVYRRDGSLQQWRASQVLELEGTDFAALSHLVGDLQSRLQVSSIDFSVSPERRRTVENRLIGQALTAFGDRAKLVTQQLGAKGYRIVDLSINTGGGIVPLRVMESRAVTASFSPPALEAGRSTLSVSANGTIELNR